MNHDFLGSERLQGTHMDALNPFKINDIEPKRRFVNLFGEFSSLCGMAQANMLLLLDDFLTYARVALVST